MDAQFYIRKADGTLAYPKYKIGEGVVIEDMTEQPITGVCWEEGVQQFTYWIEGVGHDVPENDIN